MPEASKEELLPKTEEVVPEPEEEVITEEPTEELSEEPEEELEPEEDKPDFGLVSKQLQDFKTENAYLKGLLASREQAKPKQDEDEDIDDDTFMEQLKTNPAKAIKDRDERIIKKVTKQLNARDTQAQQVAAQAAQDAQTVLQFYPDIQQNPEFLNAATQIYNALRNQYGDAPGLRTLAAHTAYGVLVKDGKITVQPKKITPLPAKRPKELETKRGQPTSDSDPLEGFNKEERESIMRTCRKFGIDPKEYRKQYDASRKEDKGYGI